MSTLFFHFSFNLVEYTIKQVFIWSCIGITAQKTGASGARQGRAGASGARQGRAGASGARQGRAGDRKSVV